DDLITERILYIEIESGIRAVVKFGERTLNVIAQAEIQGKFTCDLPVVLNEYRIVLIFSILAIVVFDSTVLGQSEEDFCNAAAVTSTEPLIAVLPSPKALISEIE